MTNRYRWRFASDAVRAELGESPETLLETGEEVKSNPVRRVVRAGDYFLKCDLRGAGRFRREWRGAELLRESGIPVVEYLACGESPNGGCLVTRALPDSESVGEYYWRKFVRGGEDPEPFLKRFAPFVRKILESGLFHPDFHIGNILCDKRNGSFVMVDAMGIRRATLCDRLFRMYRMRRIPMELREPLGRERMIALIGECGIPSPAEFFDRALDREADALWNEWPKRRRQILAGYPKFTRRIDGILHTVDPLRRIEENVDCVVIEDEEPELLEKMFLAHFFLQLALIPHRRAAAYDPENGRLYLEPVPGGAVPARAGDQEERMAAFDLTSGLTDWISGGKGKGKENENVRFFNLKRIAKFM